jgi:hypothetical protein
MKQKVILLSRLARDHRITQQGSDFREQCEILDKGHSSNVGSL